MVDLYVGLVKLFWFVKLCLLLSVVKHGHPASIFIKVSLIVNSFRIVLHNVALLGKWKLHSPFLCEHTIVISTELALDMNCYDFMKVEIDITVQQNKVV